MPGSISDQMLAGGAARLVENLHGETIKVLSGVDAGKSFTVVRETEADLVLTTDLGQDPRAKRILRFREGGGIPQLASQDTIQTSDGKKWTAVRAPQDGYLSVDFELKEIVAGKDQ